MLEGVPSKTAIGPATRRAAESAKPEAKRICCDEFAKYFITPRSTAIGESRWPRCLVNFYLDFWKEIGVGNLVLVRTRYFDDAALQAKRDGFEQFVVLGAGYDSRAYRLFGPNDGVAVYEVDFPATQAHKQSLLATKLAVRSFPWVRYVPINFLSESLEDALAKSDFRADSKTFFLWEGVTYYLTEDAVRATFRAIRKNSAPGSRVAFDYLHFMPKTHAASRRTWHDVEEPLLWGIEPEKIGEFLQELGFVDVQNETATDAGVRYWREKGMRPKFVSPTFSLVSASTSRSPYSL